MLTARAAQLLGRLWELATVYVKVGVVMAGLKAPAGHQLGLFGEAAPLAAGWYQVGAAVEARNAQMMAALAGLNARFGRRTVQLAAALGLKGGGRVPWQGQAACVCWLTGPDSKPCVFIKFPR